MTCNAGLLTIDFEWGDVIHCRTELWALCVALTALALSKVGGFSTFPASTHTSANRVGAPQLELVNDITHRGGSNSKHTGYLCSEQKEIGLVVFGMMKKASGTPPLESSKSPDTKRCLYSTGAAS